MSEPGSADLHHSQKADQPGSRQKQLLRAGLLSFGSILVAELGDKTQLATLLLSADTRNFWLTFSGAALALVLTSFIGVWAGAWVAQRIPPRLIKVGAGVGFILIGGSLLWGQLS
jgi:putative Ca2+/H+ antiporter (TMEM165/GDT1 family)